MLTKTCTECHLVIRWDRDRRTWVDDSQHPDGFGSACCPGTDHDHVIPN